LYERELSSLGRRKEVVDEEVRKKDGDDASDFDADADADVDVDASDSLYGNRRLQGFLSLLLLLTMDVLYLY